LCPKLLPRSLPRLNCPETQLHEPWTTGRGYWIIFLFQNDFGQGGPRLGWALRLGPWGFDGFAEAMRYSFIKASKLGLK